MKTRIYAFVAALLFLGTASCSKKEEQPQKWEYLTMAVWGLSYSDFSAYYIEVPQAKLDSLGNQGWELVDVYTRIETAHPNFGNAQYVTGLQPNTRTSGVCYVFKRPKQELKGENDSTGIAKKSESKYIDIDPNMVVRDTAGVTSAL